ncbi:MAG: HEAT repeat domain-containing protein [Acidobacteriia bacterium]|nr:HEAT repeat domain-containing protein [Terriglobia bacterium]
MLSKEDAISQKRAGDALNKAGVVAVPPLLEWLRKPQSESATVAALRTLEEITIKDGCQSASPEVISMAVTMLTDSSAIEVRRQAAIVLGRCGRLSESLAETAVGALTEALSDRGIREDALWALGNLNVHDSVTPGLAQSARAVPAVQELLQRSIESEPMDRKMARAAMITLGQLGPSARSAVPLIFKLFNDRDPVMRSGAIEALGGIGEPSAVPLLAEALNDRAMQMRELAARTIGYIFLAPNGRESVSETVPILLEHLRDEPTVREAIVLALARSGSIAAVRPVMEAIRDPDPQVRMSAASGLAMLAKDPGDVSTKDDALKALVQALNDSDSNVVVWTASALRAFGPAATTALPSLRRALGRLNGDAADAIKAAIELIETTR